MIESSRFLSEVAPIFDKRLALENVRGLEASQCDIQVLRDNAPIPALRFDGKRRADKRVPFGLPLLQSPDALFAAAIGWDVVGYRPR